MIVLKPHTHTKQPKRWPEKIKRNIRGRNSKQNNTVDLNLGLSVRSVLTLNVDGLNIPAKGQFVTLDFLKFQLCYL